MVTDDLQVDLVDVHYRRGGEVGPQHFLNLFRRPTARVVIDATVPAATPRGLRTDRGPTGAAPVGQARTTPASQLVHDDLIGCRDGGRLRYGLARLSELRGFQSSARSALNRGLQHSDPHLCSATDGGYRSTVRDRGFSMYVDAGIASFSASTCPILVTGIGCNISWCRQSIA